MEIEDETCLVIYYEKTEGKMLLSEFLLGGIFQDQID
jgi:hypothetical protein